MSTAESAIEQADTIQDEMDYVKSPPKINKDAFWGLLDDMANVATANTEANKIAVAVNTMAMLAAVLGREDITYPFGDSQTDIRPSFLIIGATGVGKGISENLPRRVFDKADQILRDKNPVPHMSLNIHNGGLSSGEGIAHAIRDPSDQKDKDGNLIDEGVIDKRLLVIEPEFSNVLAHCKRDGNTLSSVIRNLHDGIDIKPLTKSNKTKASRPHVVIVGHITPCELLDKISKTDIANGFLNRFMMLHIRLEKLVAAPTRTEEQYVNGLADDVVRIIQFIRLGVTMTEAPCFTEYFEKEYPKLRQPKVSGVIQTLFARAPQYARMLAMMFALMDTKTRIEKTHLQAAIYWLEYWKNSIAYIFQEEAKERELERTQVLADKVHVAIREIYKQKGRCSQTDISDYFNRNKTKKELRGAIEYLLGQTPALITEETEKPSGGGRSVQLFRPTNFTNFTN